MDSRAGRDKPARGAGGAVRGRSLSCVCRLDALGGSSDLQPKR